MFSEDLWRILSIEGNNLKIIKEERLPTTMRFDNDGETGRRLSGYCNSDGAINYGCNAWSTISNFENGGVRGEVIEDSELNNYLNTTYLSSLSEVNYVQRDMTWNIGPSGTTHSSKNIYELRELECLYRWIGDVALINTSEYLNANSNSDCWNMTQLRSHPSCFYTNYLYNYRLYWWWALNADAADTFAVTEINGGDDANVSRAHATKEGSIRPVLYLKSNIKLKGKGTEFEPYEIEQIY